MMVLGVIWCLLFRVSGLRCLLELEKLRLHYHLIDLPFHVVLSRWVFVSYYLAFVSKVDLKITLKR